MPNALTSSERVLLAACEVEIESGFAQMRETRRRIGAALSRIHAERLYRAFLGRWPDDVQAWFDIAEVQFHFNYLRGETPNEARDAFQRVLDYDPGNSAAMIHLIRLDAGSIHGGNSLVGSHATIEQRTPRRPEQPRRLGDTLEERR